MSDRKLTARGRLRRTQLMAEATQLFAERGFHPTSVAEICTRIEAGKGVFYWYFSSKEELFLEILRDAQRDLRRRQHADISEISDPVERIAAGVRTSVLWSAEHRELFRLFEFAQTDERFAGAMRSGRKVLVADAAEHLAQAIEAGRIPDASPEHLAHAIFGVSSQLTMEFIHHRSEPADDVADVVVAFCLGGIGATLR